jgi:hypothetical protein
LAAESQNESQVRFEVVVPEPVAQRIVDYVRQDILPTQGITVVVETVEALRTDQFC